MHSFVLKSSTKFICPVLTLLAIYALYRGHNEPGGGFIGGLILSASLILKILAFGSEGVRASLWLTPVKMLGGGLAVAFSACLLPFLFGKAFLQSVWLPTFSLPLLGEIHLGSPLLFDIGVFLVVIGFTLTVILDLQETE